MSTNPVPSPWHVPAAIFSVMSYNVLCDKYATKQIYAYCPTWALEWEYRRKGIMDEILSASSDIICLQVSCEFKFLKPHCTTYSYLRPLYSKQCLIGVHWSPMVPFFLNINWELIWWDNHLSMTMQGGLNPSWPNLVQIGFKCNLTVLQCMLQWQIHPS